MHLNLTKSRDNKLLQDLLDKKLRVIVVFEDDYLNHIARIAYKDIQQDNYTYRIGKYNIYKGEEWGFCDFCKRNDCYFIVPNETTESGSSGIPNDLEEAADEYSKRASDGHNYRDLTCGFIAEAKWQKEHQFCSDAPKEKSVGGNFLSSHKDKNLDEIAQDYVDGVKQYNQEPTWDLVQTAVCYGAGWQKDQFEKNRLAHCDALSEEDCDRETDFAMEIIEKEHRQPTFIDAINYGMRLQAEKDKDTIELAEDHAYFAGAVNEREQMLKEAKDGYVSAIIIHNDGDEEHYAVTYPIGERPHSITDKVKIIVIKEDDK